VLFFLSIVDLKCNRRTSCLAKTNAELKLVINLESTVPVHSRKPPLFSMCVQCIVSSLTPHHPLSVLVLNGTQDPRKTTISFEKSQQKNLRMSYVYAVPRADRRIGERHDARAPIEISNESQKIYMRQTHSRKAPKRGFLIYRTKV